jgi:hypothetical protein
MDYSHPSSNQPLPQAAIAALHTGRMIEAIKILRQEQGLGLKDAKERVDQYVAKDPLLREQFGASQSGAQRGCVMFLAGLIVFVSIGLFIFFSAKR